MFCVIYSIGKQLKSAHAYPAMFKIRTAGVQGMAVYNNCTGLWSIGLSLKLEVWHIYSRILVLICSAVMLQIVYSPYLRLETPIILVEPSVSRPQRHANCGNMRSFYTYTEASSGTTKYRWCSYFKE